MYTSVSNAGIKTMHYFHNNACKITIKNVYTSRNHDFKPNVHSSTDLT